MFDAEEPLYRELGALLDRQPIHDVPTALVVAPERALATEADRDADNLVFLALTKFAHLLAEEALDMLNKDNDGRHQLSH